MKVGDQAFFYHSQSDRAIVGTVEITRPAYPDPTAKEGEWSAVDIRPLAAKPHVTLARLRAEPSLAGLLLLKQGRLSVTPVSAADWKKIQVLGS
mgnify:CR=1 FL=1